mmetsp:Transcript_16861/g.42214  ORF Transcript_16861/g.42214 Transcript_16861/m.42214 type:complete len:208 (-) Transcript_16861:2259-2882(-)
MSRSVLPTLACVAAVRRSPALTSTPRSATRYASRTWGSAERADTARSVASGSRRAVMRASSPTLAAARSRTASAGSARFLTEMVCIWGTNGLMPAAACVRNDPSVARMAALIWYGNRSPVMRMSGPTMAVTYGRSTSSVVRCTSSPSASAAASRTSLDPPCRPAVYTGTKGPNALGRHRPATRRALPVRLRLSVSLAVATASFMHCT